MKKNRIEKGFRDYRRKVMPINAGPRQVVETRRAFFAGIAWFAGYVSDLDDDEQKTVVNELGLELKSFSDSVEGGKA